jgi:hypothetical protein
MKNKDRFDEYAQNTEKTQLQMSFTAHFSQIKNNQAGQKNLKKEKLELKKLCRY